MRTRKYLVAAALFVALAGVVWASACSAPEPTAAPAKDQPATPKPIMAEERVKWYQDCWNDFNDKKWDEFKTCYATNATSQQVGYGKDVTGPDAIVGSSAEFAKSAPDVRGEGQLILVNGPHIASAFILKGTSSGPMMSPDGKAMPPTKKKFGLMFGHAVDLDPAALKVVKEMGVQDSGTFASQLGLSKMPARPVLEKGADAPKIVIAKNDATEAANVDVEKAEFAAWNKHDAAAVDAFSADDMVFRDLSGPKDSDKKQSSEFNKGYWKAFSDAKLTTSSIWAAGDYAVTVGTFEGTNDGNFPAMGFTKTGKQVKAPFLGIDRFEGGKIKESWLFLDGGTFAAQLGLIAGK
jgi:predicted ester cyclase